MGTPLACVVGARPNLVKAAPLLTELRGRGEPCLLVHTGQHYDHEMSRVFFHELDLPEPDAFLGVGSGSHGVQTAQALVGIEGWLVEHPARAVLAIGDVNSTLAAALAAVKLRIPVVHVEAGYRSGDMKMPEEVNRLVADHVASLLFPPTEDAAGNLAREGIDPGRVHACGNLMAQAFLQHRERAEEAAPWARFGLERGTYVIATVHRPENADDPVALSRIAAGLDAAGPPVVWPLHPRVRPGSVAGRARILAIPPLPYLEMIGLLAGAAAVATDSGGVQEEACLAGVPCVTIRTSTERVVTLEMKANRLVSAEELPGALAEAIDGPSGWPAPPLWDEGVAARMADVLGRAV